MPFAEMHVPAKATSVGVARHFLVRSLEQWDLQGLEYDASVVLSELVTNSVLHAGTDIAVRLTCESGVLRIEVRDSSTRLPITRRRSVQAATGRGLMLVQALATTWGTDQTEDGKAVWAEFSEAGVSNGAVTSARQRRGAGSVGSGTSVLTTDLSGKSPFASLRRAA